MTECDKRDRLGQREGSLRKWLRRVPALMADLGRREDRCIQICPLADETGVEQATLNEVYSVSGD